MKILIVGSGPNWKEAPFEDPSYEVWTYGLLADLLPRVDLVFEMHRRDQWTKFRGVDDEAKYVERLNKLGKRIWMHQKHDDIPLSEKYPRGLIASIVGPQFHSTIAYQLGMAILEQIEEKSIQEVYLSGLDLCTYEEWASQRPNVNRLIGFLQGLGVRINMPSSSKLLGNPFFYGYEVYEENPKIVDSLILEDLAQLGSLMSRMADHHFLKKQAELFAKEHSNGQSNHNSPVGEENEGPILRGERIGPGEGDSEITPGRDVSGGEEEMARCEGLGR